MQKTQLYSVKVARGRIAKCGVAPKVGAFAAGYAIGKAPPLMSILQGISNGEVLTGNTTFYTAFTLVDITDPCNSDLMKSPKFLLNKHKI